MSPPAFLAAEAALAERLLSAASAISDANLLEYVDEEAAGAGAAAEDAAAPNAAPAPPPPPPKPAQASFSELLSELRSLPPRPPPHRADAPPSPLPPSPLPSAVWSSVGPVLAEALSQQGRFLTEDLVDHLRKNHTVDKNHAVDANHGVDGQDRPLDGQDRPPDAPPLPSAPPSPPPLPSAPSALSEYKALLSLLLHLSSLLPPLDQHDLSQELLSLNTPVCANELAKVSAAGVAAVLMMATSLARLNEELSSPDPPPAPRPRRLIAAVAAALLVASDSLYPTHLMDDSASEASGFDIPEDAEPEPDKDLEARAIEGYFLELATELVSLCPPLFERLPDPTPPALAAPLLRAELGAVGLATAAFEHLPPPSSSAPLLAASLAVLSSSEHLSVGDAVLRFPLRLRQRRLSRAGAGSDLDASSSSSSDPDAPPPPFSAPSLIASAPFSRSPRWSPPGAALLARACLLEPGAAGLEPFAGPHLLDLGLPHAALLIREGEERMEDVDGGLRDAAGGE
ncbi:hypothetical protein TeGR_g8120, partial [Tetraparma gracilis]